MRNFLLLCNRPTHGTNAQTILEHLDAIKAIPGFHVREVSMLGDIPATIDLERFDVIGIHYSLHISDPSDYFLSRKAMDRIAAYTGIKCIWMHDEYRQVNATVAKLCHMKIDTVFTVVPEATAAKIYTAENLPNTTVKTVLTGYVAPDLRNIEAKPFSARDIDVVYRARRPPFWLGSLAMEKIDIGLRFEEGSRATDIKTDISVEEWDRIYAGQWLSLLQNTKAGLAVESGASVVDFTGEAEALVEAHMAEHKEATFAEVEPLLADHDNKLVINCISPRIFELAACRTLIIAFPGEYSGIIEPWVHYLPLEKDFSNFSQIVQILRNEPDQCAKMIENAYQDLIASNAYNYEKFSLFCAQAIPENNRKSKAAYSNSKFFFDLHRSPTYLIHRYITYFFQSTMLRTSMRRYLIAIWARFPTRLQTILRPYMRFIGR